MRPVIFLNSHPIQYFAPLYRQMNAENIELEVWYCSDESIKGKVDKGFGTKVKWDIPLLDGYSSVFLKNISWKPSIYKGFWGLINPGVISKLYNRPKSVIIIHGWAYSTHILTIIFGKLLGHVVCYRGETPLNQELKKPRFKTAIKYAYLRMLFLCVSRIFYIGKQNKLFYEALSINKKKLSFAPYCVDNDRFRQTFHSISQEEAREKLGLDRGKKVILYSGKYIEKKRPIDLLKAFQSLNLQDVCLVFAGDGELRNEMEQFIFKHQMEKKVILTGFVNQTEIPLYYRSADLFVMCSGEGETWGLSVNEAMNFGIPVIVSDTCGSAYDLIEEGRTGSMFQTGNISQLAMLLNKYINLAPQEKEDIQKAVFEKIDQYSYKQVIAQIKCIAG